MGPSYRGDLSHRPDTSSYLAGPSANEEFKGTRSFFITDQGSITRPNERAGRTWTEENDDFVRENQKSRKQAQLRVFDNTETAYLVVEIANHMGMQQTERIDSFKDLLQ